MVAKRILTISGTFVFMKAACLTVVTILWCCVCSAQEIPDSINTLLIRNTCNTCHKVSGKIIGPGYKEIAARGYSVDRLVELIYEPEPSNWPDYPPMLPLPFVDEADALAISRWIAGLDSGENKF